MKLLNIPLFLLIVLITALGTAGLDVPAAAAEDASDISSEISVSASDESGVYTIDLDTVPGGTGTVRITDGGTVRLTGSLNGQIVVDAGEPATLILAGVTLTGENCLKIDQKDTVTIETEAGTMNTLSDGESALRDDAPAVITAKGRLILGGYGTLNVVSGAGTGITGKRTVTVESGTVRVTAENNGIKADGEIDLVGGSLLVTAQSDALKAETGRVYDGCITVSGGSAVLICGGRGINAEVLIQLTGGTVTVRSIDDAVSAQTVNVADGTLHIDTTQDPFPADASGEASEEPEETGTEAVFTADGIRAENLWISGGSVVIAAGGEGVQADLSLIVSGGHLDVTAAEDGAASEGTLTLADGTVTITAEQDAVQAAGDIVLSGGTVTLTAGDGGGNAINHAGEMFGGPGGGPGGWGQSSTTTSDVSCKGLKSAGSITINGGDITINAEDDAVHCSVLFQMDGGSLTICSTDDAVHSDDMIVINDGMINVTDCFEGIEAFAIEVNGGDIELRTVNDGVNANGSEGGMFGGGPGGFPGQSSSTTDDFESISGESTTYFTMNGGRLNLVVTGNTQNVGDGIDSNGAFTMTGGTLTVSTRGDTQEGAIDTGDGKGLLITGGQIIAGGASMMQEGISEDSTQCAAVISTNQMAAGTVVTVLDSEGNEIFSQTMADVFNCLVITHPAMTVGNVYTVTYGDNSTELDFTSSNVINMSGGFGFGGFPGGGGGFGGGPF